MMAVGATPSICQITGDLALDLVEAADVEFDAVHLVDDHRDLPDAQQMQQIAVAAGLVAHAFGGIDDQDRGIGLRRAGDHVAQEFGVARRVDQHDIARRRAEANLAGVDRDALVALGLQRIEQERPFERHAAPCADCLEAIELSVGKTAGFVQQPADQRRFAVIDMADDDNANERPLRQADVAVGSVTRIFMMVLISTDGLACYRYPAVRSRSNASSDSWSMARPERSGMLVASSSAMISSIVEAFDATGDVMSASPSER